MRAYPTELEARRELGFFTGRNRCILGIEPASIHELPRIETLVNISNAADQVALESTANIGENGAEVSSLDRPTNGNAPMDLLSERCRRALSGYEDRYFALRLPLLSNSTVSLYAP